MFVFLPLCAVALYLPAGGVAVNERRLYEKLLPLANYRPQVRPRRNSTDVVVVEVDVELNQILTLSERNQILYTSGFVVATWRDDYLRWDPEKYGNITSLILPPNNVWLPDIGFINSADTFYHASYTKDFRVHVKDDGVVMWAFGGNFATSCTLDMTFFPFDAQHCDLILENWAYTGHHVELLNRTDRVLLNDYHTNGEWHLCQSEVLKDYIYHTSFPGAPFPKLSFRVFLQRKPAFFTLNIITPCSFIVVMSLVLFWLPAESGEKTSLGITVLLAFSVFQLVVADTIPRTSDTQPVLSIYLAFVMGMSAVSTINAVVVLYFHHHLPNYPVPKPIREFLFGVVALILGMRDQVPNDRVATEGELEKVTTNGPPRPPLKSVRTMTSRDQLIAHDGLYRPKDTNQVYNEGAIGVGPATERGDNGSFVTSKRTMPGADNGMERASGAGVSLQEIAGDVRFLSLRAQEAEQGAVIIKQWQCLGRVVDRFMFFVCSVLIVSMCLYFFLRRDGNAVTCSDN